MEKRTVLRNEERFRVKYLGGHSLYSKEVQGILYVTADYVRFESSKFTEQKVEFGFPMKKLKQVIIESVREPESVIFLRFALSPISVLDSYRKVVGLEYEEEEKVQHSIFHFLDDEKDIRKNLFLKLLPPTVKGVM